MNERTLAEANELYHDMTNELYVEIRGRSFDEILRQQDADEERRNLQALYEQGEFPFDE